LEIDNLQTHFFTPSGVVRAVDGVSYAVRSREILGVVGESGCGKSVTALSVLRLVADPPGRIVGGAIRFARTNLLDLTESEKVGAKKTLGGVLPEWVGVLTGSVLVAFAAFCLAAAVWRELSPGTPPPRPDVRRLARALMFALNGFLALVALAALLGICFGRTGGS
jgi:energy-coupling factor transporter ATP-binding protein EcfA2